jgi:hypothetical protein
MALLLISNCKDREQDTTVLPPATQEGKNTGGALVNGQVWVAKIEYPDLNPGGNNTEYIYSSGEYKLKVVLRNISEPTTIININIKSLNDLTNTTYYLNDGNDFGMFLKSDLLFYQTNNINTGSITITKFDKVNKFVSGTFSFMAKNANGDIVTITEGRFDRKFL